MIKNLYSLKQADEYFNFYIQYSFGFKDEHSHHKYVFEYYGIFNDSIKKTALEKLYFIMKIQNVLYACSR